MWWPLSSSAAREALACGNQDTGTDGEQVTLEASAAMTTRKNGTQHEFNEEEEHFLIVPHSP